MVDSCPLTTGPSSVGPAFICGVRHSERSKCAGLWERRIRLSCRSVIPPCAYDGPRVNIDEILRSRKPFARKPPLWMTVLEGEEDGARGIGVDGGLSTVDFFSIPLPLLTHRCHVRGGPLRC